MAIINSVDEAFAFVKNKLELAEKRANDTFPSIQKLNDIKNAPITNVGISNAFTFSNYYSSYNKMTSVEQINKKLEEYKLMLEANITAIEETHKTNLAAIENNKLVKEKVAFVMGQIGMPTTYSKTYYKTNRSRTPTTETVRAGWFDDLQRIAVSDGYEAKISAAKQAFESLKKKAAQEIEELRKQEQIKEKEEKAKKEVLAKSRLQVKYGLTEDSDWDEVLEALDKKDKYFMLARAMNDVRNDWNEGFGRVQYAISNFATETPEDEEIYGEIHTLAYESEDIDGRCFRDCEYNYSVLYAKVDEDLMKDWETLKEYYGEGF
jgi:MFS superfamily sulfate permease-like transporter